MQNNTADQLYSVMLRIENPARCLSHRGICLRQQIIQGCPIRQSLLIFLCFITQLFIRQIHHRRSHIFDFFNKTFNPPDFPLAVCAKHFLYYTHITASLPCIKYIPYQIRNLLTFR